MCWVPWCFYQEWYLYLCSAADSSWRVDSSWVQQRVDAWKLPVMGRAMEKDSAMTQAGDLCGAPSGYGWYRAASMPWEGGQKALGLSQVPAEGLPFPTSCLFVRKVEGDRLLMRGEQIHSVTLREHIRRNVQRFQQSGLLAVPLVQSVPLPLSDSQTSLLPPFLLPRLVSAGAGTIMMYAVRPLCVQLLMLMLPLVPLPVEYVWCVHARIFSSWDEEFNAEHLTLKGTAAGRTYHCEPFGKGVIPRPCNPSSVHHASVHHLRLNQHCTCFGQPLQTARQPRHGRSDDTERVCVRWGRGSRITNRAFLYSRPSCGCGAPMQSLPGVLSPRNSGCTYSKLSRTGTTGHRYASRCRPPG